MNELIKYNIVDLQMFCPTILIDMRYATVNNFTEKKLYKKPTCFLYEIVAKNLCLVQKKLYASGIGLKVWDGYRPVQIQQELQKYVSDPQYVAPLSNHAKGIAVDVTLVNVETQEELPMPTEFDDFTEKAGADYENLPPEVLKNREILKSAMHEKGFSVHPSEWWHYDFLSLKDLPSLDIPI